MTAQFDEQRDWFTILLLAGMPLSANTAHTSTPPRV